MNEQLPGFTPDTPNRQMHEIQEEIAATRAELAATVDELSGWFDPHVQASRLLAGGRRLVADVTDPSAEPDDRRKAWIILGIGVGVAAVTVAVIVRRLSR